MIPGEQPGAGNPGSELRPPDAGPESVVSKTGKHGLVWGALSVVIMLGLVVLLVLPKLVSEAGNDKPVVVSEPVVSAAAESSRAAGQELANSRSDAARALQDFLHIRARLELANAPVWGEPEWSQAVDGAARGNDLFGQRKFSLASEVIRKSLELLQLLESQSGQRLANALNSGWQALQTDDSAAAVNFFAMALAIEADNEDAINGLERSRVRPDLLRLMTSGSSATAMNDLHKAQAAYTEAVGLDGQYEPAAIALQDVTAQITDLAFRDAMSRALNALEAEQIKAAELALGQAAGLKPGEQVVRDTQYQLAQVRQKLWLASQRRSAAEDERNEDWASAVTIYRKVLARVPQAAFARRGLELAEDRERLHRQLDHYLADPTRVWSAQPLANAEKLLASAARPPVEETRLAGKINRLQTLIIEARTPLTVTLQSDGLTSVLIYHVGRLGSFTSQQLELTPGTYTVVGSRPGYRDVRQTFTVKPGSDLPALDIRCEETV